MGAGKHGSHADNIVRSLGEEMIELNGFVKIWGEIRFCHLSIIPRMDRKNAKYLNIRISAELHDGVDSVGEFIEQIGGKLYESLDDYKKDKFIDVAEWVKKNKIPNSLS